MSLVLLNLQSNQEIKLEKESPFIIGRNNVNGCFDKRVSRSHGKITWTVDEKIHLVALHNNPLFFTKNGTPPVLQLVKNEEQFLKEGDCVGLLPDSFWFQIKKDNSLKEKKMECKLKNNKIEEIHIENTKDSIKSNKNLNENKIKENRNLNINILDPNLKSQSLKLNVSNSDFEHTLKSEVEGKLESSNTSNSEWGLGNPEFEKTRRLPLWMYQIEEPIKNNPNIEVTFKSKSAKSETTEPASKKAKLEPVQEELSSTSSTTSLPFKIKENLEIESITSFAFEENKELPNKTTLKLKDKTSEKNSNYSYETLESEKKDCKNDEMNVSIKDPPKRRICQYDNNCYRKNPQHKLYFCHPGDEDYIPYEKRPFCQYGESCYRQNKMHKVEFRHSPRTSNLQFSLRSSSSSFRPAASPLPSKRKRKTANRINFDDNEDYDECDLEDPFTNDASSDEYVPSEIDEEEEELGFVEDTD